MVFKTFKEFMKSSVSEYNYSKNVDETKSCIPVRINETEFISFLNQIFMIVFVEYKCLNSAIIKVDNLFRLN